MLVSSFAAACSSGGGGAGDAASEVESGGDDAAADVGDDRDAGFDGDGGVAGAEGGSDVAGNGAAGAAGSTAADGGGDALPRDGGDATAIDTAAPADAGPRSVTVMVTVPGAANLAGAGHAVLPPDPTGPGHQGIFPTLVELPAGTGRTMTVTNVLGGIDIDGAGTLPILEPDGFVFTATPATGPAVGGLSGPTSDRHASLSGVFLGDAEPAAPAPPSYVVNPTASTINGLTVAQMFFIGDGLDGALFRTGDVQMFRVPDGATRVFLGFLDIDYLDNLGAVTATVTISR